MDQPTDLRRFAPATQRNREPILEVLMRVLPTSGTVLEVASGTGEHAVWFAQHLRPLAWQPSDSDPAMLESIAAHALFGAPPSLMAPLRLDVTERPWPLERAEAVVCINLLHIAPWAVTRALFEGAAAILPPGLTPGAPLTLYGPFRREGVETAPGNLAFDAELRAADSGWGLRRLEDVHGVAEAAGFGLDEVAEMPSNNLTLVFRRS